MLLVDQRAAIVDLKSAESWNGADLGREIDRRAGILRGLGITRGFTVAIAHGGSGHFFADLFAVWSCGAAAACLDEALTTSELKNVLEFAAPAAVLVKDRDQNDIPSPVRVLDLAREPSAVGSAGASESRLDDPALILFTSGTTGDPKGVELTFRALLARLSLNAKEIGADVLKRTLVTLPTHFGHGLIGNALTPLFSGGEIFLPPRGLGLAQKLGSLVDEHEITFMSSVPSFWHMTLRGPKPTRGSLKRVHVGSAPLSAALWQSIANWTGSEVWNCYGISETANWVGGASSREGFVDGKIGAPWGGRIGVQQTDGKILQSGEGEIVVQTPSLMSRYLKRDELTKQVLINGWYRTGDVGRVDEAGVACLSGRIKDEINRAGMKIQPADVDMLLESHPSVEEACSFGLPDPVSHEIIGVAVKLRSGFAESDASLRDWCLARSRAYTVPDRWFFVQEIPRTSRGKTSRAAVRSAVCEDRGKT